MLSSPKFLIEIGIDHWHAYLAKSQQMVPIIVGSTMTFRHQSSIQLLALHVLLSRQPHLDRSIGITICKLLSMPSQALLNRIQHTESPRDPRHGAPDQTARNEDPEEVDGEVVAPEVVGFGAGVLDVVHVEGKELEDQSVTVWGLGTGQTVRLSRSRARFRKAGLGIRASALDYVRGVRG